MECDLTDFLISKFTKSSQKATKLARLRHYKNWKCCKAKIIIIDAHGLKIQGRGYLMFFAKIPRGVKAFRKNCLGGSPYFGFYCIFINKCFEICLRGVLYLPSPLTPLCASMALGFTDGEIRLGKVKFGYVREVNVGYTCVWYLPVSGDPIHEGKVRWLEALGFGERELG